MVLHRSEINVEYTRWNEYDIDESTSYFVGTKSEQTGWLTTRGGSTDNIWL